MSAKKLAPKRKPVKLPAYTELVDALRELVDERDRAALTDDPAFYWLDKQVEKARALLARIDGEEESK